MSCASVRIAFSCTPVLAARRCHTRQPPSEEAGRRSTLGPALHRRAWRGRCAARAARAMSAARSAHRARMPSAARMSGNSWPVASVRAQSLSAGNASRPMAGTGQRRGQMCTGHALTAGKCAHNASSFPSLDIVARSAPSWRTLRTPHGTLHASSRLAMRSSSNPRAARPLLWAAWQRCSRPTTTRHPCQMRALTAAGGHLRRAAQLPMLPCTPTQP